MASKAKMSAAATVRDRITSGTSLRETGAGGLEIATRVRVGDTANEISSFCREHHVDLIVVGSHESGRYRHRLYGSVCESLLRRAPAPVLIFPAHASRLTTTVRVVDPLQDAEALDAESRAQPQD